MPIRPDLRKFYGAAWREIRARILTRAGNQCEQCGKPLHAWIFTYTWQTWYCSQFPDGKAKRYHMAWIREGSRVWRNEAGWPISPHVPKGLPRKIRVKLTVAHVDNNPGNMSDRNLRAWCTWCHLHHDQPFHKESRSRRKDAGRPLLSQEPTCVTQER